MSIHKEIHLETEICEHLAANGWLYAEGDAADVRPGAGAVSRGRAGVGAGDAAEGVGGARKGTTAHRPARRCSTRLRDPLDQRGTLDVLRHGIELLGLRATADAGAVQAGAWR